MMEKPVKINIRYVLLGFASFLAVYGIQIVLGSLLGIFFRILYYNREISESVIYNVSVLSVVMCGLVFCIWYRVIIRYGRNIKYKSVFIVKNIGLIILLGLGCQMLISAFLNLILPLFQRLSDNYSEVIGNLQSGSPYMVLLLAVIIAPVSEELIFRGVILSYFKKGMPLLLANLLQAVLFGIYHMNIVQGIYAFLLGSILGYTVIRFRTIYASIFLHMVINGSSFIVPMLNFNGILYVFLFLGAALLIVSIILIRKGVRPEWDINEENKFGNHSW